MSDQPPASPPSKIPALSSPSASSSTAQRLTKIEIENYRAYRGTFRLDLANGENLLVYGENGAGKSSLFHTLRTFLEAPDYWVKDEKTGKSRPVAVTDHRHCFSADVPEIKLEIGAQPFVWTETINDTVKSQVRLVNQGKGFLDYKALLDVHYVRHGGDDKINVFDLLIERLLPYYTYPNRGQNQTFQVGWKKLKEEASKRWYGATRAKEFKSDLATFNDALESEILTLGRVASNLLARFGDEFGMEFQFQKATFQTRPKHIEAPRILVRPAFRKKQFDDYHNFLNEARLSALAICLFFAALKGSPASGLRILALDDILIGLDMANRLTVLGLVEDMFREWQVIVLTYHKAWFRSSVEGVIRMRWFSSVMDRIILISAVSRSSYGLIDSPLCGRFGFQERGGPSQSIPEAVANRDLITSGLPRAASCPSPIGTAQSHPMRSSLAIQRASVSPPAALPARELC